MPEMDPGRSSTERQLPLRQQWFLMIIPLILFTIVEEWGGLAWALVLSIVYAVFEVAWEARTFGHVEKLTLFSNGMVVGLSAVSYFTQDGVWFKMQPAILELAMAGILFVTSFMDRPLLLEMMRKQGHQLTPPLEQFFRGLNKRLGLFFLLQSILAVYASFYWSTQAWALLKSVGLFAMMIVYMLLEVVVFRRRQVFTVQQNLTKDLEKL